MVLDFEEKTYESFSKRLFYSNCKMGFVGLKYKFYFKVFYIIENIIEIAFLMFFMMLNQKDFFNINIKIYGNYFNNQFNIKLLNFTNLDSNVGYLFNFLDIINKLNSSSYVIPLIMIIFILILKFSQFCYFLTEKANVISVNRFYIFLNHIFSLVDQLLKTFGDIIIMIISLSIFSCSNDINLSQQILQNLNINM